MAAAIHFIKFIIRVLLFFVIQFPFIVLWVSLRYWIFKFILIRALVDSGMPKVYAKDLAKEMWITKFASAGKTEK